MKLKAFGATEQKIYDAVNPMALQLGYTIWDVSYEKEGACWYLRIFIDSPNGITIQDCEAMTAPVNAYLDANDPISENYILEVGSAGLERELCREWHFPQCVGMEIRVRSIRPIDGQREWIGTLIAADAVHLTLETENGSISLPFSELALIKRYEAFEF